jgi:tetratricopeptide (TPR) repeat protein
VESIVKKQGTKMKTRILLLFILSFILFIAPVLSQEDLMRTGEEQLNAEKFDAAIKTFSKVIKSQPKNKLAFLYRGISYMYNDKIDKAIKDFDKVLTIDANDANAYNSRGLAYSMLELKDKAYKDFDKALMIDPKLCQAYLNRGNLLYSDERFGDALQDMKKSVDCDSTNPAAFMQRGNVYYAMELIPEAIADFNVAISKGLTISKIYYNRGNAYYKDKKYKKAIEDYNVVLGRDNNDLEALNNRSIAYDKLGDKENASKDRKRLLELTGQAGKYPAIETLEFVTYVSDKGDFSINLPKNWLKFTYSAEDINDLIISHDSIKSMDEPYAIGVKLSLNKNMFEHYKVKGISEILNFWSDNNDLNTKEYFDYRRMEEKHFGRKDGFSGYQRTIQIQVKKEMLPLILYEYIVAKDGILFWGYFQAPVTEWDYYKPIFDKAIKSIAIK